MVPGKTSICILPLNVSAIPSETLPITLHITIPDALPLLQRTEEVVFTTRKLFDTGFNSVCITFVAWK